MDNGPSKRLVKLMEAKGMTPLDLTVASGVSEHVINSWRTGRRTPYAYKPLKAVADALGTTPEFITLGTDPKSDT